jgi:hypothetical protein
VCAFLLYDILGLVRPPPTREEIADELEHQHKLEEVRHLPPVFDPKVIHRHQYAIDELISSEYTYQRNVTTFLDVYGPVMKKLFSPPEWVTCFSLPFSVINLSTEVTHASEAETCRVIDKTEIGHLFLDQLNVVQKFVPLTLCRHFNNFELIG